MDAKYKEQHMMIKKLYGYLKGLDKRIKFVMVGGLNTLIGYGINALMLLLVFNIPINLASKATEVQVLISSVTGHIAGMLNAYFWNKYFTFESRGKSLIEVGKFLIVSLSQLALNYGMQLLLQNVIGIGIYPAQILTLVVTTVFSYVGHNYFTFKKSVKKAEEGQENTTEEDKGENHR